MIQMTYTRCSICQGSLRMEHEGREINCACIDSKTPGWDATGLTLGQIERMVDVERTLAGDPGLSPERRLEILEDLEYRSAKALDRLHLDIKITQN